MEAAARPRVTVVVPVHNTSRYLEDCLGSVFAQTMPARDVEIIAVDDGSTDDSLDVLRRLQQGQPNLEVLHQEASGSAAAPRNAGIDASHGDYLFFLDSDDRLHPQALERLVSLADETGSGIVLPRMTTFGSSTPRASGTVKSTRAAVGFIESKAYRTAHPGKLYRASLVRDDGLRFPTGFRIGEDMAFTYAVGLRSPHVSMLGDQPYYFLRWRDDSTSLRQRGQSTEEVLLKNLTVMRTVLRECSSPEDRILLLQRSVLGRGGLWKVFTHPRVDELSPERRHEAFAEAHETLRSCWRPEHRRSGDTLAHVFTTLIWKNDESGVQDLAAAVADGEPLAIKPARGFGPFRRGPRFVSSTGTVVEDVVDEPSR